MPGDESATIVNGNEIDYADVVIIGAGYAGLNALVSANSHLITSQYALIADVRADFGGHWFDAYDFVHLHQPYQFFTAYDRPWGLESSGIDRRYLASREEVLTHFHEIATKQISQNGTKTLFKHRYISHHESEDGKLVHVVFQSIETGTKVTVRTPRVINAIPLALDSGKTGLVLSSTKVLSTAPKHLSKLLNVSNPTVTTITDEEIKQENNRRDYVVVGSGKTAMDTILFIRRHAPLAHITLIAGRGAAFMNRDRLFATEKQEHAGNEKSTYFDLLLRCSMEWDGMNERSVLDGLLRDGLLVSPIDDAYSCQSGLLSESELSGVQAAVEGRIIKGRMKDIIDNEDGGVSAEMQDGRIITLSSGEDNEEKSILVVNCTSHFKERPQDAILQCTGKLLSPQMSLFLTGPSATALTHAWFLDTLSNIADKLYAVRFGTDEMSPEEKSKAFFRVTLAQICNFVAVRSVLPQEIADADRTDISRWYTEEQKMKTLGEIMHNLPKLQEKCEKLLVKYPTPC